MTPQTSSAQTTLSKQFDQLADPSDEGRSGRNTVGGAGRQVLLHTDTNILAWN